MYDGNMVGTARQPNHWEPDCICRLAIRQKGVNANGNALDEKGKKYGSFNQTSVNSFCPVVEGVGSHLRWGILTRPQVGDFEVAIGEIE